MRNMAKVQTPTVEIATDGDNVTLKTITTFKTQEIKFKLGEEFEEKRLDGAMVKSKVTLDGNKLVQHQEADTPCDIIREVDGDKLKTVSPLIACGHSLRCFFVPADLQMWRRRFHTHLQTCLTCEHVRDWRTRITPVFPHADSNFDSK